MLLLEKEPIRAVLGESCSEDPYRDLYAAFAGPEQRSEAVRGIVNIVDIIPIAACGVLDVVGHDDRAESELRRDDFDDF
jgi:hypothetical protein